MLIKSMNINLNSGTRWIPAVCLLLGFSINSLNAGTLRVAVASNFLKTAQELAHQFESQSQHKIQLSSGSSGKLYLQITKGAPYDLFLSADPEKPRELVKSGWGESKSVQTYALGKLLLWLKSCDQSSNLSTLSSETVQKIALANPQLAPYGFASKQLLINKKLWHQLEAKAVYPENISQVSQFAKIGVVDAAFIAASHKSLLNEKLTNSGQRSCLIDIPVDDYPAIEQQLVIISRSKNKTAVKEFVDFMRSSRGQDLIKNMGYLLPDSDKIESMK